VAKNAGLKFAKGVVIASVVIIVAWLWILSRPEISARVKRWVTGAVVISPIPPFP